MSQLHLRQFAFYEACRQGHKSVFFCLTAYRRKGGVGINYSGFATYISSASLCQLCRLMNCNCFLATVGRRQGSKGLWSTARFLFLSLISARTIIMIIILIQASVIQLPNKCFLVNMPQLMGHPVQLQQVASKQLSGFEPR